MAVEKKNSAHTYYYGWIERAWQFDKKLIRQASIAARKILIEPLYGELLVKKILNEPLVINKKLEKLLMIDRLL